MGQIKVEKNVGGIQGLCVIEPTVHGDSRGYFMETYNENDMKEAGLDMVFVQDNQSCSTKGVLRGLHFQKQFPQIEVETSMPEEVVMAPMDGILVEQVLVNLMENSALHGETTTKIRISVQKLPERVLFCVEDNGKGIATKDLTKIFDRFYRTDASRNSTRGGSGIGLSIVKKILEDHGGKVWATSKEGVGTTMYFVLRKYQEVPVS